jgi:hypothetical protein
MKMNRIILLLSLGIIACSSSKEDIAKKNIEEHLLKQMNDAKSYEFVSIDSLQFYSKFDSISIELKLAESENTIYKNKVDSYNELKQIEIKIAKFKNVNTTFELDEVNKDIEDNNNKISALNSVIEKAKNELLNQNLKKELVEYRTNFHFRGKNALGALMLNSAYVRLDKDMKVKELTIAEPKIGN